MPPRVTALRAARGGKIAVELEGAPWRTLPGEVVLGVRLVPGIELDRTRARELRRALRRHEALAAATAALRFGDLSTRRLGDRLERAGVSPRPRDQAIGALARAGLLDDARLAAARAATLADRGLGDAAIRHDLVARGIAGKLVAEALAGLEPERDRAERLSARLGGGLRAARALARRGFGEDSIAATASGRVADEP